MFNTLTHFKDISSYPLIIVKQHTEGWYSLKVFDKEDNIAIGNIIDASTITYQSLYDHSNSNFNQSLKVITFKTFEGKFFLLREGKQEGKHSKAFLTLYSWWLEKYYA